MADPVTITLVSVSYPEVHFTSESGQPGTQVETELGLNFHWHRENNHLFMVSMDLRVSSSEGRTILTVQAMAHFQTNAIVDEEFRNGPYVRINAPTMVYPFLRAFIGTFMTSAGFPPIYLPSFNFMEPGIPMTDRSSH